LNATNNVINPEMLCHRELHKQIEFISRVTKQLKRQQEGNFNKYNSHT